MKRLVGLIAIGMSLCLCVDAFAQTQTATQTSGTTDSAAVTTTDHIVIAETPPNMVLLYYGYDSRGPRDWNTEQLKYYLGYYKNRGTENEQAVDTFFDTVLWMFRTSSRGRLFETSLRHEPTAKPDWDECLARLFEPDRQLNALQSRAAKLERELGRPVRVNVVLTLPYPDVRIERWNETEDRPQWDFRSSDEPRLAAVKWYIDAALQQWNAAGFKNLRLLGFYWFNEGHINLRDPQTLADPSLKTDLALIRSVARYIHSLKADGRSLTLSWIPYSPYGGDRVNVIAELLRDSPEQRIDYLMVQPNYFFAKWKKSRTDLMTLVRNVAAAGMSVPADAGKKGNKAGDAGIEIEFDSVLVRDEAARQRLRDYLEVIPAEHPRWDKVPAGYYQGLRAVHDLATHPELDRLYEDLYEFLKRRQQ